MFDKKYNKAMKVLNEEIMTAHELFLTNIKYADIATNEITKSSHIRASEEWHYRIVALHELKNRILKVIES